MDPVIELLPSLHMQLSRHAARAPSAARLTVLRNEAEHRHLLNCKRALTKFHKTGFVILLNEDYKGGGI